MAIDHYENFPVASILLPRRLRSAVHAIYRYARTADDIADEGTATPEQRLQQLANYRAALEEIGNGRLSPDHEDAVLHVFQPLALTIQQHQLPLQPFADLLSAFEQDVVKTRYQNDDELFDYCRRSADPVGRIMLHLYEAADPRKVEQADAICTGLQLTNFWQDVAIDWQKDRVYIPQDQLHCHGVSEDYIAANTGRRTALPPSRAWQQLMRRQVQQAREKLLHGLPLSTALPGRPGYELRLVVQGGLRILERLDELHYDVFYQRPTLKKRDWIRLAWRAISMSAHASAR